MDGHNDWLGRSGFRPRDRLVWRKLRKHVGRRLPVLPAFAPDEGVGRNASFTEPGPHDTGNGWAKLTSGRGANVPRDLGLPGQWVDKSDRSNSRCGSGWSDHQRLFGLGICEYRLCRTPSLARLLLCRAWARAFQWNWRFCSAERTNPNLPRLEVLDVQFVSVWTIKANTHNAAAALRGLWGIIPRITIPHHSPTNIGLLNRRAARAMMDVLTVTRRV